VLTNSSTRGAGTRPLGRGPATFERGRVPRPNGSRAMTELARAGKSTAPMGTQPPSASEVGA
jgi:hypothetical protein